MKKLFLFLFIPLFSVSCTNQSPKESENTDAPAQNVIVEVSIHDILADTESFLGKEISIKGTVEHVCEHGGKKMFVFGESPEDRIKIIPDKNMNSFEIELEGSDVLVQGVLIEELRVDEEYLAKREKELSSADSKKSQEELEGEKQKIEDLKEQLDACDYDHLSFYVIECSAFEEIK